MLTAPAQCDNTGSPVRDLGVLGMWVMVANQKKEIQHDTQSGLMEVIRA